MKYAYDQTALERDPNLTDFNPDLGTFKNLALSGAGARVFDLLTSRAGVLCIFGSVAAAPLDPPVGAVEHLLFDQIGEAAFTDELKRLTGRIVRHIVEHLSGHWTRSGVPLTIKSRYNKGSIYDFGARA